MTTDDHSTFNNLLSIHVDQPIESLSISPANRDVALGARKGLFIIDLQNPYDTPRFIPAISKAKPVEVQWNPWVKRSEWVASTSNQQAIIYNLSYSPSLGISAIEHTLHAHQRGITDLNWASSNPEILATCGMDGRVWSFDLRTGRSPVWGVFADSPASQVKWNRKEAHIIASAHDSRVMIWDDRMGSTPVTTIQAHSAKIYGIDWSRRKSDALLTCSLDKSFKYWDTNDVSNPVLTVNTSAPVWRARYLPFGRGVLTIPQRSDFALSIWGRTKIEQSSTAQSVARFEGSKKGVQEFVWRTRGGQNPDDDDRRFQLITWSKDRRLRLWPISDEILKEVGHVKNAPMTISMTRRNCPDISYRTFAEVPAPPQTHPLAQPSLFSLVPSSPLGPKPHGLLAATLSSSPARPSLLTSSLLSANLNPNSSSGGGSGGTRKRSASMTITRVRNRSQRANDRLAWMTGVKVLQPPIESDPLSVDHIVTSPLTDVSCDPISVATSVAGSTRRGATTEAGTLREGGETARGGESEFSGSKVTGTATKDRDTIRVGLGEEITSVVRRFPRINFEKVHIAGRSVTVSLYTPSFLRATFTFPRAYPQSSATIEIERSTDINLKSRAYLLRSIRELMSLRKDKSQPSFEAALRFLLGDRSVLESFPVEKEIDEDDEDDEDDDELSGMGTNIISYNVPPPRRGGATFGPQGQLIVFFPTNLFVTLIDNDKSADVAVDPVDLMASVASLKPRPAPRLSEAFGYLSNDVIPEDNDYVETDEALQYVGVSSRPNFASSKRSKPAAEEDHQASFSSIVYIKNVAQHLAIVSPGRTMCSLKAPILGATLSASLRASEQGDLFLSRVWSTMASLFDVGEGDDRVSAMSSPLAERLLPELISFLRRIGDVQTLGVIACLLESYRRTLNIHDAENTQVPVDYFNHRTSQARSDSACRQSRTPTIAQKYDDSPSQLRSNSPLRSWANLSGFFNSSVMSLRSHGSPNGASPMSGSPDQLFPGIPPLANSRTRFNSSPSNPSQLSPPIRPAKLTPRRTSSNSPNRRGLETRNSSTGIKSRSPNVTFKTVATIASTKYDQTENRSVGGKVRKRVAVQFIHVYETSQDTKIWWLTDEVQTELELYRFAYAELLFRWNDLDRLKVLGLCRTASQDNMKLGSYADELLKNANGLGSASSIVITPTPHQVLTCALCHLPISGLSQNCTLCSHAGHVECFTTFFSQLDFCPTGCGCSCASEGGLAGAFLISPPVVEPVIPSPRRAVRQSLPYFA